MEFLTIEHDSSGGTELLDIDKRANLDLAGHKYTAAVVVSKYPHS